MAGSIRRWRSDFVEIRRYYGRLGREAAASASSLGYHWTLPAAAVLLLLTAGLQFLIGGRVESGIWYALGAIGVAYLLAFAWNLAKGPVTAAIEARKQLDHAEAEIRALQEANAAMEAALARRKALNELWAKLDAVRKRGRELQERAPTLDYKFGQIPAIQYGGWVAEINDTLRSAGMESSPEEADDRSWREVGVLAERYAQRLHWLDVLLLPESEVFRELFSDQP
jgi:hypothetical protein